MLTYRNKWFSIWDCITLNEINCSQSMWCVFVLFALIWLSWAAFAIYIEMCRKCSNIAIRGQGLWLRSSTFIPNYLQDVELLRSNKAISEITRLRKQFKYFWQIVHSYTNCVRSKLIFYLSKENHFNSNLPVWLQSNTNLALIENNYFVRHVVYVVGVRK